MYTFAVSVNPCMFLAGSKGIMKHDFFFFPPWRQNSNLHVNSLLCPTVTLF